MKAIAITIVVVVMTGLAVKYFGTETVTYVKEGVTTEVVKEVTPDWAKDEDAVKAAQAVIRKKELEAERGELQSQIDEKKKRVIEIDKELGTF